MAARGGNSACEEALMVDTSDECLLVVDPSDDEVSFRPPMSRELRRGLIDRRTELYRPGSLQLSPIDVSTLFPEISASNTDCKQCGQSLWDLDSSVLISAHCRNCASSSSEFFEDSLEGVGQADGTEGLHEPFRNLQLRDLEADDLPFSGLMQAEDSLSIHHCPLLQSCEVGGDRSRTKVTDSPSDASSSSSSSDVFSGISSLALEDLVSHEQHRMFSPCSSDRATRDPESESVYFSAVEDIDRGARPSSSCHIYVSTLDVEITAQHDSHESFGAAPRDVPSERLSPEARLRMSDLTAAAADYRAAYYPCVPPGSPASVNDDGLRSSVPYCSSEAREGCHYLKSPEASHDAALVLRSDTPRLSGMVLLPPESFVLFEDSLEAGRASRQGVAVPDSDTAPSNARAATADDTSQIDGDFVKGREIRGRGMAIEVSGASPVVQERFGLRGDTKTALDANSEESAAVCDSKCCQTSFVGFVSSAGGMARGCEPVRAQPMAACSATKNGGAQEPRNPPKPTRLPTPMFRWTRVALKSPAERAPTIRQPAFKAQAKGKGSCGTPSKSKFDHIRSPVASYIRDYPAPPLIQNIKPRMVSQSQWRKARKMSARKMSADSSSSKVRRSILKRSGSANERTGSQVKLQTTDVQCLAFFQDDDNENVPPGPPPLPFVSYKGSQAVVLGKDESQQAQSHTIFSKKLFALSPRAPMLLRHTGQHKKIDLAKHVISSIHTRSSPGHPSGFARPILIKNTDLNKSDVDGPNTIDVSIVEALNINRSKVLSKK